MELFSFHTQHCILCFLVQSSSSCNSSLPHCTIDCFRAVTPTDASRYHKPAPKLCLLQVLHVLAAQLSHTQHGSQCLQSPWRHFSESGCRQCCWCQLPHDCSHSGWLHCPQGASAGMVDLVRFLTLFTHSTLSNCHRQCVP